MSAGIVLKHSATISVGILLLVLLMLSPLAQATGSSTEGDKKTRCKQLMQLAEVFAMNRLHRMNKPAVEHARLERRIRHILKTRKTAFIKKCVQFPLGELKKAIRDARREISGGRGSVAP